MTYSYRLLQGDGSVSSGSLDARSRQEAFALLESKGQLLHLEKEKQSNASLQQWLKTGIRRGVTSSELSNFTRQLSALLAAGIPLASALEHLIEESSENARQQWQTLSDLVVEGASLADAMGRSPQTFPRVYVAMVRAGETGGFLDLVLRQIADFQEREKELKGKMLSAITYPLILTCLSIAVLGFLMIYFIPKFQTIFSDFGAQLPKLTQVIVATSDWIRSFGLYILPVIGIGIIILYQKMQTAQGKRKWESLLLQLPVISPLMSAFAMTRFCRMLGTLVGSGVPLLTALRVARESLGNQILVDAVEAAVENVQKGGGLAASLAACDSLFPKSALQIIAISEQTGQLDEELGRLANNTERELDARLRLATALAEPVLLFLMAAFVGTIVVGMVLPIFTLQDYIK